MKLRAQTEIAPDEILLDAHNLPAYDASRLEGRLEQPLSRSVQYALWVLILCASTLFLGRLWYLQVVEGSAYVELSERNRLHHSIVFAERGVLFDRNNEMLVWNAPNEAASGSAPFSTREYTNREGLGHVLGYVSLPQTDAAGFFYKTELAGVAGVEKTFNHVLNGTNGLKIVETDALLDVLSESTITNPEDGESLTLSIDAQVEEALYTFIKELADDVPFRGGAGVIMDVHTGELLALTSYPEYKPSAMVAGSSTLIASYQQNERTPFVNRIVSGQYTPGSIVKPYFAYGALDAGIVAPSDSFVSTGALYVPNPYHPGQYTTFADWKAHGIVDVRKALAVSSNVYFYYIGGGFGSQEGLGIARLEQYARLFGMGEKTGIALQSEAVGVIPTPEWKERVFGDEWRIGDTYFTAIGQYGFQVTPIQMVRAVAMLANGGTLLTPRLVPSEEQLEAVQQGLNSDTLSVVREGMRDGVLEGTAAGLNVRYVDVAAKTGTAELGTSKDYVNSWATGFFPYENPRYAFVVLMEHGSRENIYGGVWVMRRLLDWMEEETPEYLGAKQHGSG